MAEEVGLSSPTTMRYETEAERERYSPSGSSTRVLEKSGSCSGASPRPLSSIRRMPSSKSCSVPSWMVRTLGTK